MQNCIFKIWQNKAKFDSDFNWAGGWRRIHR